MNSREIARMIFLEGVRSVLPEKLIKVIITLQDQILTIGGHIVDLNAVKDIYVIGAGKASAAMGHYVENILGNRISGGHIVVKYGYACKLKRIEVTEAGHPVPDKNGFAASESIIRIAGQATENDLVICLISGGGSALLADLPGALLPEEIYIVNNLLVRCGATISEINCVRKHLSGVKGGQLARIVYPARLFTLILSDVVGDPPDVIASGPTVADPTTFSDALKVLTDYSLTNDITAGVINYLKDGAAGKIAETPKPDDPLFQLTFNILAGNNLISLNSSKKLSASLGFKTYIIDAGLTGDVENACDSVISTALSFRNNNDIQKPVCLLYGGETTIRVTGSGTGGRNQHLALLAALRLKEIPGITVLAAGTDGNDGPTGAAGAVADNGTYKQAKLLDMEPESYVYDFNSYEFFKNVGGHVVTGPTFTNVMDIIVVIIE